MGRGRWPVELRDQYFGDVPPSRHLCWAHSARRQTCRTSSRAIHQIRIRHQSANRKNLRPANPAHAVRARRRGDRVKRREFITLLGGAAAAWPLAARAQQQKSDMRTVGVIMSVAETDTESQARIAAFRAGFEELWKESEKIHFEYRWTAGRVELATQYAREVVALAPAVILANGTPVIAA